MNTPGPWKFEREETKRYDEQTGDTDADTLEGWGKYPTVESVLAETLKTFYHATRSSNVPAILRDGLIPKKEKRGKGFEGEPDAVYLFNTRDDAENGTTNWLGDLGDEEPLTLLRVTIPGDWVEPDPERSLSASRVLRFIPPEYIEVEQEHF